jgi:Rrf2 family protein
MLDFCAIQSELLSMLSSSRFVVAVHALSILARHEGKGPVCSNTIAGSVDTNPVVIRRLMSALEDAKLVKSTAGRLGGFELARGSDSISLADIYSAVEDKSVFRMHKTDPASECPVAVQMQSILEQPLRAAEEALQASLKGTSLYRVAAAIH